MTEMQKCTICGRANEMLFSNRPLHKGREETLLICAGCIEKAKGQLNKQQKPARCSWCGNHNNPVAHFNDYAFCANCVASCQAILREG